MFYRSILRIFLPILILAMALAGFMLLRATGPSAPEPISSERVWPVAGFLISPTRMVPSVELYARSHSPRTLTLRSAIEADILDVTVRPGTLALAGEPLLQMDTAELEIQRERLQADLREAQAALDSEDLRRLSDEQALIREQALLAIAERALQRTLDLRTRNLGSESDVDTAQRSYEQTLLAVDAREQALAQAPLRRAQQEARIGRIAAEQTRLDLDLSRADLRAVSAQRIVDVYVSAGERVRVGDPLLRSFSLDDLELRAPVPEGLLAKIEPLLEENIPLYASGRVGEIPIRAIARRLDAETRTGEAGIGLWLEMIEGVDRLPLNRFVTLRLEFPPEDAVVAIPHEALYGRNRVFRIIEGRLSGLTVERLGESQLPNGEIRALIRHPDLQAGDMLIGTRLPNAVEGLRVQVERALADQGQE